MTYSVYHVGLGIELNLTEPDLGHPDLPGLWEVLHADKRPVAERQLQCMQCRETRPSCPEWMHLRQCSGGRRTAVHNNPAIGPHASGSESDQHKAFKERIARAAELGGHAVVVEDRAEHGKRRTDVLIKGDGGINIGCEVQLSPITTPTVRKRAKIARADGITPLWTAVDATREFINQVPWALTDDMAWREIANGRELLVRGGVRLLEMKACDWANPDPCPLIRGNGRCGKLHGRWVTQRGILLDDLVRESAAGEFVPVIVPGKRVTNRWWVRREDREIYAESVGRLLTEDETKPRRSEPEAVVIPRPLETECRYGQDTGHRSPPAPVRDDGSPVDASVVTRPLVSVREVRTPRLTRPGHCGAGADPCGAPARLYPCGWRCSEHAP